MLLVFSGGPLGAALADATVKVLKATGGGAIPRLDSVSLGWQTTFFCFAAALVAAIIAGFVPAIRASRLNLVVATKGGPTSSASRADRRFLACVTMAQTALTLALLVGAGLLIRTVVNLAQIRPGYDTDRIVSMTVTEIRESQQADVAKDDQKWYQHFLDFHRRALSQVTALPGVEGAAWSYGIPLTGNQLTAAIRLSGEVNSEKFKDELHVPFCTVTPGYFNIVGLPILAGRNFGPTDTDRNLNGIVMINQAMAKRFFANTDPVGKRFRMAFRNSMMGINRPFVDAEIIGVAADSSDVALTQKAEPEIYGSFWQFRTRFQSLVVRTAGDPRSVIPDIQHALQGVDPTVAIGDVKTFEQIRNDSIAPQLFTMHLLSGFSLMACALALIGIYGVLSLSVASREKEMAIRMSLGSPRRNILGLILGDGLRLVGVGVVIGAVFAFASTRALRALLFGVEPTDPTIFIGVAILFVAVAMVACFIPARRATKIAPMEALRYE